MKYAVIQTGGKQYKVAEGDVLEVERLKSEAAQDFQFEQVLLYTADGVCKIGQPNLDDVSVTARVLDHIRGEKLRIGKFKAKARYRRLTGHRQALTKVQIQTITIRGEKAKVETKAAKVEVPVKEEKALKPKTQKAKSITENS